jgi:flagellar basal body-associated protein FliL
MSRKKVKKTKTQETEKYQAPPKKAAKIPILLITIILIAVLGIGYFTVRGNKTGYVNAKDVTLKNTSSIETVQKTASIKTSDANFAKLKGGETKPVLSPARFTGKTASSYRVAQENPELMDAMYCYCYCKKTIGHKSLLSCFADQHASKCGICQDQAFYAKRMLDKGLDIGQVRKEVDKKFWRPFS